MKIQNGIKKLAVLKITALVIGILISLPIIFIFIESINSKFFSIPTSFFNYFKETLYLILLTSSISFILGVVPAWIITYSNIKFKNFFDLLLVLPLAIPTYIMAFTYADIFGYNGYFDLFLQKYFNRSIKIDILTIEWLSLFLSFSLYPYIYSTSRISFSLIGNTYINLAKSLGLSKVKMLFRLILPLSMSGIFSGIVLVIMEILNEYGAVKYFGIKTFSVGVFQYWFAKDMKSTAIFFSLIIIFIVIGLVFISNNVKKKKAKINYHIKSSNLKFEKGIDNRVINSNYLIISAPIFLALIVPISFIILNVKFHYADYNFNEIFLVFKNSVLLTLITSFIITIITFFLLSVKRYTRSNSMKVLISILSSGYAIPGAVIGLAVLLIVRSMPQDFTYLLSSTISLLVYAYIFRFIAVSIFPLQSNFKHQPLEYDELGKSLGLNSTQIFTKINFPLSKVAIITSFIVVFIDVLKELPLTLILRPFNYETLATEAYKYAGEEMLSYSSIFSLFIILTCVLMISIVKLILKKK